MGLYDAFISYSHAKDKPIAAALQSTIQKLGKPWYRRRTLRLFRDDTSLSATPHLWPTIEQALGQSRFFLLLASPEAAESKWVEKEVECWLRGNSIDTLLIGLTDGELIWDGLAGDFATSPNLPLPQALAKKFSNEPKWVDLRPYRAGADGAVSKRDARFTDLAADFAAAIRSMPKEDLLSEEVRQQRRALTLAWSSAATLAVLIMLAGWQWWEAERAKKAALDAEQVATEQKQVAQTQRDQALLSQSRLLADLAQRSLQGGETTKALLLALEALPDSAAGIERPYSPEAELALSLSRVQPHERMVLPHASDVSSAAFSPDDRLVVTACRDNIARIWDRTTGKLIRTLTGHMDKLQSAAFSADGRRVVTASEDLTARVWDVETGNVVVILRGHQGAVHDARFSPNGLQVVTAASDSVVRVWDIATATTVLELHPQTTDKQFFRWASFSSDGRLVTAIWRDLTQGFRSKSWLGTWEIASGKLVSVFERSESFAFDITADRQRIIASTGNNGELGIIDINSGKILATLRGPTRNISRARFSPDERLVVTASQDRTARVWVAATGDQVAILAGNRAEVIDARFSSDGRFIVTASKDQTARIWFSEVEEAVRHLEGDRPVAFSPDGRLLATVAEEKGVILWDTETWSQVQVLPRTPARMRFSADGRRLFMSDGSIWDVLTGQMIKIVPNIAGEFYDVSPDGRLIVTAVGDGYYSDKQRTAYIWDVETGSQVGQLSGHALRILSAVFSPDGRRVLTGSLDGTARLWDVSSGRQVLELKHPSAEIRMAVFSPDGRWIVTAADRTAFSIGEHGLGTIGDEDKPIRIWDAETGEMISFLYGQSEGVYGISFRADGHRLVTLSKGRTARIWDFETRKAIAVLAPLKEKISEAVFSPDGRWVATAHELTLETLFSGQRERDRVRIRRLFATTQELIDETKRGVGRCLTRVEREGASLLPDPPVWCVELEKWPYQGQQWKDWLQARLAGSNPPLPDESLPSRIFSPIWVKPLTAHPTR